MHDELQEIFLSDVTEPMHDELQEIFLSDVTEPMYAFIYVCTPDVVYTREGSLFCKLDVVFTYIT